MMNKDVHEVKIGVVGGGSWGTALANLLGSKGYAVDFWVFEPEVRDSIISDRENRIFLPGITLSENLFPSNDLGSVVSGKDLVLIVVPSHVMREISIKVADTIASDSVVVSASKGIENQTHLTMSGILRETPPPHSGIASRRPLRTQLRPRGRPGRTHGRDGGGKRQDRGRLCSAGIRPRRAFGSIPTRTSSASSWADPSRTSSPLRRASSTAWGWASTPGRRLSPGGSWKCAAWASRWGANPRTFTGTAGIGDLVLTCTGDLSRNHTVGKKIGQGMTLTEILAEMRMVAEGVKTAKSVYNLSRKLGVEMPICHEIYYILYEGRAAKGGPLPA